MEFIRTYFAGAQTIRIASAYFSLAGYKIGRRHAPRDVRFHILVGREDGPNVKKAVIEEIKTELASCEEDLWRAVEDLVQRIETGRFTIRDARSMEVPFHCKFYICDDETLWHGSSNFSKNGILHNAEQVTASHNGERIAQFTGWFDRAASAAENLLDQLLKVLRQWLERATPFDAYLKMLYVLSGTSEAAPSKGAHQPTFYQKAVIARTLSQLHEFGGSLVVLATGLGKTIVGAEVAYRLHRTDEIDHVVLLAPNAVRNAWTRLLDERGLHPWFFGTDILFRPDSPRRHHKIHQLTKRLRSVDERTLILVDEAHFYRNQLQREKQTDRPSRVFSRLGPAVQAGARIVLLTATAYSTSSRNFDSLLQLLPHRSDSGTDLLPGPWQARDPDAFTRLPVVTVLGLPDVLTLARKRGDLDAQERPFVLMGDQRQYLPTTVRLIPEFYMLPLEPDARRAFDAGCFNHAVRRPQSIFDDDGGEIDTASDSGYNAALTDWMSSPPAFRQFVRQNLSTPDQAEQLALSPPVYPEVDARGEPLLDTLPEQFELLMGGETDRGAEGGWGFGKGYAPFQRGLDERKKFLEPLLEQLDGAADDKLMLLARIVRTSVVDECGKVLVFVARHRTALYLSDELRHRFLQLNIGCTVELRGGKPALRSLHARTEIQHAFSPRAHGEAPEVEFDVLICTDADGVGVNLQDADTVVNYDLPGTADILFQRAGRVLRTTPRPDRTVRIHTMVPRVVPLATASPVDARMRERVNRLQRRHARSSAIIGSSLFSETESIDLLEDRTINVEKWFQHGDLASSLGRGGEHSLATHLTVLEEHRERAAALPEPLHSARFTGNDRRAVAVVFQIGAEYRWVLYDPQEDTVEKTDYRTVLDLVRSTPDEPIAPVAGAEIEGAGNRAVHLWCSRNDLNVADARKICVVYLLPLSEGNDSRRAVLRSLAD